MAKGGASNGEAVRVFGRLQALIQALCMEAVELLVIPFLLELVD